MANSKSIFDKYKEVDANPELDNRSWDEKYDSLKDVLGRTDFGYGSKGNLYGFSSEIEPKFIVIEDYLITTLRNCGWVDVISTRANTGSIYVYPYGIVGTLSIRISDHKSRGGLFTPTYNVGTLNEAKEVVSKIGLKSRVDTLEMEYKSNKNKIDNKVDEFVARIKDKGLSFGAVERTYEKPDIFASKHPDYLNIRAIKLGANRFGEEAYKYQFLRPIDSSKAIYWPDINYVNWAIENIDFEFGGHLERVSDMQDVILTPAFKSWFKDSKVVDKNGRPLVVYHGSPDLRGLKEDYIFKTINEVIFGTTEANRAFFFTDSQSIAKSYADPRRADDYQNAEEGVLSLYLSIQNPLIVNAFGEVWRKFETTINGQKIIGTRELVKYAQGNGYDGLIVIDVKDYYSDNHPKSKGGNVYVAFYPKQIKLADGTNTTFESSNADIRYRKGGAVSDENKETYKKWGNLVNMSSSELRKFYDSNEGKEAGLTANKAHELGIHSGRESARWIMKMKDTPVSKWTKEMWDWAKRQVSFVSRMRGNSGAIYDNSGNKTRKHTSLLIWGHNPEKYNEGGEIAYGKLVSASSRFRPKETIYFDPPLVGKNGAKLNAYTWYYEYTEDFSVVTGDVVSRRISDWNNAEVSADTGRGIVHVYSVEMPDGTTRVVSSESVPILLGYVDRVELKSFPNLVTASKTLAKQQMQLLIMEAQLKEYNQLQSEFKKAKKPEIKEADFNQIPFILRRRIEISGDDGENTFFSMGDIVERQSNIYSNGKYNKVTTPNSETISNLTDNWIEKRVSEMGGKYPKGISDLKNRVERQKIKVSRILNSKMELGGELVSLLAPNGQVSKLTPEQYKLVRTNEFKAWFGDWENYPKNASKVIDDNGEPLVVYHGTPKGEFNEFNIVKGSDKKSKMQLLFGSHFASDKEDAEIYAKKNGHLFIVFLSIKNPLNLEEHYEKDSYNFNVVLSIIKDLKLDKKFKNALDYVLFTDSGDYGGKSEEIQRVFLTQNMLDSLPPKLVFDTIREHGFDGIIYTPYRPHGNMGFSAFSKSYISFYPEQIKLADGTNTTFGIGNHDIRYEKGGSTATTYAKRVIENLKHMGTKSEDWKSVPIIGFQDTDDDKGKTRSMPIFDFSVIKGFTTPNTLYPASTSGGKDALTNCELCGKLIKNVYHIYDEKDKYKLIVGSECVAHFQEGKSGKDKEREAKIIIAIMLDKDLETLGGIVRADLSRVKTERTFHGDKKVREWNRLNIGWYTKGNHRSEYEIKIGNNIEGIYYELLKGKRFTYTNEINGKDIYDMINPFNYSYELERVNKGDDTKQNVDKRLLSWFSKNEKMQSAIIPQIVSLLSAFEYPVDFSSDYLNYIEVNL